MQASRGALKNDRAVNEIPTEGKVGFSVKHLSSSGLDLTRSDDPAYGRARSALSLPRDPVNPSEDEPPKAPHARKGDPSKLQER